MSKHEKLLLQILQGVKSFFSCKNIVFNKVRPLKNYDDRVYYSTPSPLRGEGRVGVIVIRHSITAHTKLN
jgi:hypothetical protein